MDHLKHTHLMKSEKVAFKQHFIGHEDDYSYSFYDSSIGAKYW